MIVLIIRRILSVLGVQRAGDHGDFALRHGRPHAERPCRVIGFPVIPLLYIAMALAIMFVLLLCQTQTAWRGLVIVLLGVPVYLILSRRSRTAARPGRDFDQGASA
jgi:Flp pilus assembly protein TadB